MSDLMLCFMPLTECQLVVRINRWLLQRLLLLRRSPRCERIHQSKLLHMQTTIELESGSVLRFADHELGLAVSLLLPVAELQAAATASLTAEGAAWDCDRCPQLVIIIIAKGLLPRLAQTRCMPSICRHLLRQPTDRGDPLRLLLPAALAQLVLAGHLVILSPNTAQENRTATRA